MTQRFSQSPTPANVGTAVTFCFDFTGLPNAPRTIDLDWDPDPDEERTLTPEDNCFTVTWPADKDGLILTDPASDDFAAAINP